MLNDATAIIAALVSLLCFFTAFGAVVSALSAWQRVEWLENQVKRAEAALVGEPAPPIGRARVPAAEWAEPR